MTPAPSSDRDADVRHQLAGAVGEGGLDAAWAAYADARIAGLCHEGAWEVALGAAARPAYEADAHARSSPTP